MTGFLTTIIGAFIGAGLAPFIINFFSERHKRIDKLRDSYLLSYSVFEYYASLYSLNHHFILFLKQNSDRSTVWYDFFKNSYPVGSPLKEFITLLDFDLHYSRDEVYKFQSICSKLELLKANLIVYFFNQQSDVLEDLEQKNKELLENITEFNANVKFWCNAEKENLKIKSLVKANWSWLIKNFIPMITHKFRKT